MTLRRGFAWGCAFIGVLLVSCLLYLAFVDLGRHKVRIEGLVSQATGRAFNIDGELKIELFPTVSVVAERVRLANAEWASKEPMVQVGRLSTNVGLWSLISGRVEVRAFELTDVVVLLEVGRKGEANWMLGDPAPDDAAEPEPEPDENANPLPLVIEKAKLRNIRVVYRERRKQDRVMRLDALTISPGKAGLLALEGRGKLNEYPITIDGEAGPLQALLEGRDLRINTKASVGRLALKVAGNIAELAPLDGADLRVEGEGEDVGAMFTRLELPVIATGALRVVATLKDAGEITKFDFDATMGDLSAKSAGTVKGLQLSGSDVRFEAKAADAARLAGVFGIEGIPAAPLSVSGHVVALKKNIRFEGLSARLAGVSARVDGKLQGGRARKADMRFEVSVENLKELKESLPAARLVASGNFSASAELLEITGLEAALDEIRAAGRLSVTRSEPRRIEVDLSSPRLDLTPFFPAPPADGAEAAPGSKAPPPAAKTESAGEKKEFLFTDEPLPILHLKGTVARLHFATKELTLTNKSLKDFDSTLVLDPARVTLAARAKGSLEGAVDINATLEPVGDQSANVMLKFTIENVRAGLDMKEMLPIEVPPLGMTMNLTTNGRSARQMASNANGQVIFTQGAGKTKAGFLDLVGGGVLNELRTRLNPFKAKDPHTNLDCAVARADIVNGGVTVKPVLLQTEKVTVVAHGKVDLHTETLTFDFDTRPREGIGVSPGMFANPFIRLEGTLSQPRLGMGAKGVRSGAVAAATGGISVIAGGVVDRFKGEVDMCAKALEEAAAPATTTTAAQAK
jgi:uncharacterized protein involved in outer membrane biogenesis